jgi:hypothetical protein
MRLITEHDRNELLRSLREQWEKYPRMDFTEIVSSLTLIATGSTDIAPGNDSKVLKALRTGGIRKL